MTIKENAVVFGVTFEAKVESGNLMRDLENDRNRKKRERQTDRQTDMMQLEDIVLSVAG